MSQPNAKKTGKTIAPPKGTRDAYPEDVLRRRYVTQAWRDAAIRCGFDEIEGPTFEAAELYAVKSGDGILSELFQAFSGKSPEEVEQVQREGQAPYALRPEFTPTLARMYAAKAKELPQPCKWFTAGPYFRAEKPQRGRLREFLQWNCDVIGLPGDANAEAAEVAERKAEMDADVFDPLVLLLSEFGMTPNEVSIGASDREMIEQAIKHVGGDSIDIGATFALLDRRGKIGDQAATQQANQLGFDLAGFDFVTERAASDATSSVGRAISETLVSVLKKSGIGEWVHADYDIVRGLAYYTGTVFEVIADGERAVAGGGRYDNLIELFGGPPTPACGFGMGDVVLSNLLDDKGLFPQGLELMEAVSRPPASVRPEAFVIHNGSDDARAQVRPLVAALRRGVESQDFDGKPWSPTRYDPAAAGVRPVHARQSYKATGNPGKLFTDAKKQLSRFVIEIGQGNVCTLKSLDRNETITHPSGDEWTTNPSDANYVGHGLVRELST